MADWEQRFRQFELKKQRDAAGAAILPSATDIDRGGGRFIRIGNNWSRALFDGDFYVSPPPTLDLPSTSLVFVQSHDGNTVAADPSALGGGEADKHLIYEGLSRVAADAVLVGAGTVRGGDIVLSTWHPELVALRASLGLPRHPVQIVATQRGLDFDGLIFNVPEVRVILLTVPAGADRMLAGLADRPWITPIIMTTSRDLTRAFRKLRARGIATISCVGGRGLASELLEAGLIQDVYLTTSPKDGGEKNTPLSSKAREGVVILSKHGAGQDAGVVFEMISTSGRS